MPTYLIAIDNGSQSTKVSIVDERGEVRASGRTSLRPYDSSGPGISEHPGDDIWESVVAACRSAMSEFEESGADRGDIVGVGLCTIRFCRALLDEHGGLVQPVMSWMDARVSVPYVHADDRVRHVATSSGYVTGRLTGRLVDFAGNVQGRWPVDPETWSWSEDEAVIAREGIPRELLLPLAMPGEVLGSVTAQAATATGLPAGLPVVATSNDKAVEALGAGVTRPGQLLLSLGTYVASMTPAIGAPRAETIGASNWANFASIPHRMLLESEGVRRGMWTVSWYRDLVFGGAEARASESGTFERQLEADARGIPPGAGGVSAVLDWLAPAGDEQLRGALLGFDGSQGRGHIYRAILEGLALTMHEHAERLVETTGIPLQALVVSGGGASSDLMMRILSGVFGVEASRPALPDAAGLGSAICAAVALGVHSDWEGAVDAMVRVDRRWQPEPEMVGAYANLAPRYRALRAATRDLYRGLAR